MNWWYEIPMNESLHSIYAMKFRIILKLRHWKKMYEYPWFVILYGTLYLYSKKVDVVFLFLKPHSISLLCLYFRSRGIPYRGCRLQRHLLGFRERARHIAKASVCVHCVCGTWSRWRLSRGCRWYSSYYVSRYIARLAFKVTCI